jgi:type II secretory pathway pseudopilin PulG
MVKAALSLLMSGALAAPEPYPISGQGAVAYKNNCDSNCPLLIMLHGAGGDGEKMAQGSQMHEKFSGIIAYPSSVPFATGWPILNNGDENWDANIQNVQDLIADPNVDKTQVHALGFSSGGFYTYALACAIELASVVVLAADKYVQPTCPQHTNVLHIQNRHDSYNTPVDPPNGTKPGGNIEIGYPTTLRSNWLGSQSSGGTTNGDGDTTGLFTLYSAQHGELSYDYHFYDGPSEHAYNVYRGVPDGAPHGLEMEDYITYVLSGQVPPPSPTPSPTPTPTPSPTPAGDKDYVCYENTCYNKPGSGTMDKDTCESTCAGTGDYLCYQGTCYNKPGSGTMDEPTCQKTCGETFFDASALV